MSRVWRGAGARGCVLLALALAACSGRGANDLFAPATGTGPCTNCGPGDAATSDDRGGGSTSSSSTGGGSTSVAATTTTTSGGGGGAGGGGTTSGGGAGTTGGTSAGGASGAGGGSIVDEAGITPTEDAQGVDVTVVDTGRPDHGVDAVAERAPCIPTGNEICDGIDNNCNGGIDENNACRSGCVGAAYNGFGYMFCFSQTQERVWSEARSDCQNHQMQLVRVDDAQQNAFIRKTALAAGYSDTIWIGASDLAREGTWVWIDGTEFWLGGVNGHTVNGHFAAWDMDQPNSAEGPEDCAAVWTNLETWHDVSCQVRHAYMCQRLAALR